MGCFSSVTRCLTKMRSRWPIRLVTADCHISTRPAMFEWFKKKKAAATEPDASLIVPRIKHANFLLALRDIVEKEDDMPATGPLVADLLVTYAFDLPEAFQMVCARDVRRLGLSPEQLRSVAVANLKKQ